MLYSFLGIHCESAILILIGSKNFILFVKAFLLAGQNMAWCPSGSEYMSIFINGKILVTLLFVYFLSPC